MRDDYGSAEETVEHLRYLLETGSAKSVAKECEALDAEYLTLCRKIFNYLQSVAKQHDPTFFDDPLGEH